LVLKCQDIGNIEKCHDIGYTIGQQVIYHLSLQSGCLDNSNERMTNDK